MTPEAAFNHTLQTLKQQAPSLFFAGLYVPSKHRHEIWCLAALYDELTRIMKSSSDENLLPIRLQWWEEVLSGARDSNGAPLPTALLSQKIDADLMVAMVQACTKTQITRAYFNAVLQQLSSQHIPEAVFTDLADAFQQAWLGQHVQNVPVAARTLPPFLRLHRDIALRIVKHKNGKPQNWAWHIWLARQKQRLHL